MKKKDRESLIEQVSFLTALQKKVKEYLDAHSEDSPRSELDSMVRDMYQAMGVSKLDLKVRGQKVGTVSARLSKPVHEIKPMIENGTEFLDWLLTSDGGKDTLSRLIAQKPDLLLELATADGELPDGCRMVERNVPESWLGTTLRVDADKVVKAYGGELSGAVVGLLGGE